MSGLEVQNCTVHRCQKDLYYKIGTGILAAQHLLLHIPFSEIRYLDKGIYHVQQTAPVPKSIPGFYVPYMFDTTAYCTFNSCSRILYLVDKTRTCFFTQLWDSLCFQSEIHLLSETAHWPSIFVPEHDFFIQGFGRLTYPTGTVYEGGWHEGRRSGKGKLTYKVTVYGYLHIHAL